MKKVLFRNSDLILFLEDAEERLRNALTLLKNSSFLEKKEFNIESFLYRIYSICIENELDNIKKITKYVEVQYLTSDNFRNK
jgi:hypothetical protein